ncbi:hypothetical protein [Acinetobacter indicus]|uniref:hypothetical protein n=1 Tax=Acinetobacter indicus TaxID=756892 RepID=UPI0014444DC4|nr:hypothetical protein [Acinetobacter indicus]
MINKYLPNIEELAPIADNIRAVLTERGSKDVLGTVIENIKGNAEMLAKHKIDAWLGYGVYLPAVERVIALHGGESETDFYMRTQYPVNVVEAYTVPIPNSSIEQYDQVGQYGIRQLKYINIYIAQNK